MPRVRASLLSSLFRYVIVPNYAGTTDAARKTWFLNEYLKAKAEEIKEEAETAEEEKQRLAVLAKTRERIAGETQFISADEFKKKVKDKEFFGKFETSLDEYKGHDLSRLCFAIPFKFEAYFGSGKQENDFSFEGTTFLEEADFNYATFSERANFSKVTFQREANFWSATFKHRTSFSYATFSERANFSLATFQQKANFWDATFLWEANFWDATFQRKADFSEATFQREADFWHATFQREANFIGTTFQREAGFIGTTFEKAVYFPASTFKGNLYLNAGKFNPKAEFNFDAVSLGEKSQVFFKDDELPQKATRSGARLLKEFFTKKQDQVLGDHFYRLEMDARLKNLSLFSKQGGEKVLLYVGWLTSNFGQSWIRPILCYLGFTHLFYAAALWGDASYSVICDTAYISKYLCQGPISLPEFTNPFSLTIPKQQVEVPRPVEGQVKAVLLQEKKLSWWWQGWYLISRVINIGLIYQLIVALKRKTKR